MAWDRVSLADAMIARMDRDEVEDLCFRLHVDDENLDGRTKSSLVRSLIKYMEQREQLNLLILGLEKMRPDIGAPSSPPDANLRSMPPIGIVSPPPLPPSSGPKLGDQMTDPHGVTMVYVPPGTFKMGSADEGTAEEIVIAQGFWLDLTPVTFASYVLFINTGGYRKPELWTKVGWDWVNNNGVQGPKHYPGFDAPGQPRVGVTWFEADAYCRWRGGRLPTAGEWEWAARGPDNRRYPWGNRFSANRVIYLKNSGGKTSPVSANTRLDGASWVGALDMSGNVWEWTSSLEGGNWHDPGDAQEVQDDTQNIRVVRGGSWNDEASLLQVRLQIGICNYAADQNNGLGLRCARSA
ncbi:MAG: SUMF1/EgtB/PvdO family nonheme iron enzyme [Anaerolineae bacterium]